LNSSQCNLSGVILNSDKKRSANYLTEVKSKLSAKNIDLPILEWDSKFSEIKQLDAILNNSNFGVSALFGHLLPEDVISKLSGGILNATTGLVTWKISLQPGESITKKFNSSVKYPKDKIVNGL
jgi:methionyl-tRNA formyltransferase